ncbi:hypothetical protein B4110_0337 [Parageobacillus toebii]|uniref:Uncharacterized protein n=1 Tax=Parageobacillus toebii TaxID=153151 RepID=A0A150N6Y4_9BACL|nr:hypothetical protein B4110_0337 [Parageobacillus toebii]
MKDTTLKPEQCFYLTYEELKPCSFQNVDDTSIQCFYLTYEELKQRLCKSRTERVKRFYLTYEELKQFWSNDQYARTFRFLSYL